MNFESLTVELPPLLSIHGRILLFCEMITFEIAFTVDLDFTTGHYCTGPRLVLFAVFLMSIQGFLVADPSGSPPLGNPGSATLVFELVFVLLRFSFL